MKNVEFLEFLLIFTTWQIEEKEGHEADQEIVEKAEPETNIAGSEEMELNISHLLDKIEQFTQMVNIWKLVLLQVDVRLNGNVAAAKSDCCLCILYLSIAVGIWAVGVREDNV